MKLRKRKALRLLLILNLLVLPLALSSEESQLSTPLDSPLLIKQLEVAAASGWVDTGIDVKEGEKYEFKASGTISCQKGNPIASFFNYKGSGR